MIQRIGAKINPSTGEVEYTTDLPTIYQGSDNSYYLDIQFEPQLENANVVFISFRRSDGATTPNLNMTSVDGVVWSKALDSAWYFYKPGQLKFTVTAMNVTGTEPNLVRELLSMSYNSLTINPTPDFNQPAPLAPNDYEYFSYKISGAEEDISSLDERVTDAEGQIDNLKNRVTGTENRLTDIETANPVTSLTNFEATTSGITFDENHLDETSVEKTITFPSELATEAEAESIASTAVNTYDTNIIQPKFNQIDTNLDKKVEYVNIEEEEEPSLEILSAKNVTTYIANVPISSIFENNGYVVKRATADKNGNDITTKYQTKLYKHNLSIYLSQGIIVNTTVLSNSSTQINTASLYQIPDGLYPTSYIDKSNLVVKMVNTVRKNGSSWVAWEQNIQFYKERISILSTNYDVLSPEISVTNTTSSLSVISVTDNVSSID